MRKKSKSYDTGKQGEQDSWALLEKAGFVRPSKEERREIKEAFKAEGITIKTRGFDLVEAKQLEDFRKSKNISNIVLYELKTAGKNRKQAIKEDFSGLGFTLTSSEFDNAKNLGDQYKFIFLNLKTQTHMICKIDDFFNTTVSNIYQTWSVFIVKRVLCIFAQKCAIVAGQVTSDSTSHQAAVKHIFAVENDVFPSNWTDVF